MEFGKTYIIKLKNNVEPIENFQWADSRVHSSGLLNVKSEYFNYEEQSEYETINIESISENMSECLEIGIFSDEICLGAVKIDEFPVQILAYTKGYEGKSLTFRALYKSGVVSEIDPYVLDYNTRSGEFAKTILVAGDIEFKQTKLGYARGNSESGMPSIITKHTVYPNPFNPSTTINFNITETGLVTIEVFNSKGQKVSRLLNTFLPQGNHFMKWNGVNDYDESVSSGIYFYRITSEHSQVTGKMMLLK
jgi:hypothetical protein